MILSIRDISEHNTRNDDKLGIWIEASAVETKTFLP